MDSNCEEVYRYSSSAMLLHFGIGGIVLNFLSIIGLLRASAKFAQDSKSTKNVLRYLLLKTLADVLFLVYSIALYKSSILLEAGFCAFWFNLIQYISNVISLFSVQCLIAATFDRYKYLTNTFKFLSRIPFRVKVTFMLTFSFIYFFFYILGYKCDTFQTQTSQKSSSYAVKTEFYNSTLFFALELTGSIFRDGISSLILLILNISIIRLANKSWTIKKKALAIVSSSANLVNCEKIQKDERQQVRINQMIYMIGIVSIIGHATWFIQRFFPNVNCVYAFSSILYFLTYFFNFFIYFCCLQPMRSFFLHCIFKLINIMTCNLLCKKANNADIDLNQRLVIKKTKRANDILDTDHFHHTRV